jgi:hypothetical protein
MKKQLIGTTALISVGALAAAGGAQDAKAADPLSLSVGGYFNTSLEYRDEDDSTGEPGANLQSFNILNDGEIQFTASTTLDNGIGVKARIEYEAHNQGGGASNHDERWIEFSGGFGALKIGSDDNVANAMHYQAPFAAAGNISVNTPTFALAQVGGNAVGQYPATYINTGGDAEKIIWFSPRIAGFQLGLSYAPDGQVNDQVQGAYQPSSDDDPGGQEDIISIGLNYVETFNDIDVAVSGGYIRGELESQTTSTNPILIAATTTGGAVTTVTAGNTTTQGTNGDDVESWSAGLNVGFAGFTVGGSAAFSNNGKDDDGDSTTWDAGVTYATGPLTVGFSYINATVEDTGGDDETDQFLIDANYNIGPGVDLWGGVKFYEYEDGQSNDADENEGFIIALGSSVSF